MKPTYVEVLADVSKERLISAMATMRDILRPLDQDDGIGDELWEIIEVKTVMGCPTHEGTGDYKELQVINLRNDLTFLYLVLL